jgi:diguanylate cyclase (GGDEF)-like protein
MVFNPYALILFIASILLLLISFRTWNMKKVRATREFSLLALACFFYTLFYSFELSSADLQTVLIWIRLEYLGITAIAPTLLAFAFKYTGRVRRFRIPLVFALLAIPIVTFVMVQTFNYHSLFYINPHLDQSGPFPVLAFGRGFFYWLHVVNITLAILISNLLFLVMWIRSNRVYRKRIAYIFIGSLFPTLGFFLYLTRIWSMNLDITALMLPISAIFIYYGLTKHDLFELIPVARDRLFEILPDGVLVFDSNLRLADFNSAAKEYLKLNESAIGKNAADVLADWPKLIRALSKGNKTICSIEILTSVNDGKRWVRADFQNIDQDSEEHYGQMILLHDISESRLAEDKLKLLASTDYLTGLWNRRYFTESVERELKRADRYSRIFSLIMMDLDNFKQVNDNFGHSCGDQVLIRLAGILKERLREVDTVARLGGEEFAILLPDTDAKPAYNLAEELRETIAAAKITVDDQEVNFTVSVGVSTCHRDLKDVDRLLQEVDRALYKAKERGRNCTVVSTVNVDNN